jgi:hypothetical protein
VPAIKIGTAPAGPLASRSAVVVIAVPASIRVGKRPSDLAAEFLRVVREQQHMLMYLLLFHERFVNFLA